MTSNETPSIGNPGNSVSEVQVLSRAPFLRATCRSLFASPLPKGEDARRAGEVSSAAPNGDFFRSMLQPLSFVPSATTFDADTNGQRRVRHDHTKKSATPSNSASAP